MFEYPTPFNSELRNLYATPYKFNKELTDHIDYLFLHPKNRYHKLYSNLCKPHDSNDMAKVAYLLTKHYLDHPQHYGNSLENIAPDILVRMWQTFISLNKHLRKTIVGRYYPTDLKLLTVGEGKLLDLLLKTIETCDYILHKDDMVKKRKKQTKDGKLETCELRETVRYGGKYTTKEMEYLCSLD